MVNQLMFCTFCKIEGFFEKFELIQIFVQSQEMDVVME